MRLWNDYEGKTIAGSFPIDKLIRPEGRSAFFSTTNGTGKPAVIRLIEAINDEDEILDRWNTVANLHQDHLITLRKYGHTVMDGTPLIYAVMEPSESDLAAILRERPLTLDETRQVATSLVAALQSLHASGIVHEHVEPSNVLAAGDLVKLRSDCIREAPTGPDGEILKAADVHDLAVVLLQCLTQHRTLAANGNTRLPAPFDFIIPNALHGVCTLDQIAATLTPPTPAPAPSQPQPTQPATHPQQSLSPQQSVSPQQIAPPPYNAATRKPPAKAPHPAQAQLPLPDLEPSHPALDLHSPAAVAAAMPPVVRMPAPRPAASAALDRIRLSIEADPKRKRLWLALAVAAFVLLVALGWHAFSAAPATDPAHAITPITALPTTPPSNLHKPSAANNSTAAGKGSTAANHNAAASTTVPSSSPAATVAPKATVPDTQADWHVVVFTYNHEDQAWQKVASLKRDHNSLHPEVFAPNGHAPFLVTLGGPMTREEAFALRNKARRAGLPRDTYAQNYPKAHQ